MPLPNCPTDCSSLLPKVNFSKCSPNINLSEIRRIFIAKPDTKAFENWEQEDEWTTRIHERSSDQNAIRPITVIGDKPAPTPRTKEVSLNRNAVIDKEHTINYTIDDVSKENYEFMRNLECGGKYRIWYETEGGYLFGGNKGILVTLIGDDLLNRGRDEIETIAGALNWRSKHHPDRVVSPIFAKDYSDIVDPVFYTMRYESYVDGVLHHFTDPESPYLAGSVVTILENPFPKGYDMVFQKWNTLEDGTGTDFNPGDTIQIKSDTVLYAILVHGFRIDYDANGGEGEVIDPNNPYLPGSTAIVLDGDFVHPDGLGFKKWSSSSDGSGTSTDPGTAVTMNYNYRLYAIYDNPPSFEGINFEINRDIGATLNILIEGYEGGYEVDLEVTTYLDNGVNYTETLLIPFDERTQIPFNQYQEGNFRLQFNFKDISEPVGQIGVEISGDVIASLINVGYNSDPNININRLSIIETSIKNIPGYFLSKIPQLLRARFGYNKKLEKIPTNLFNNNYNLKDLSLGFQYCENLTGETPRKNGLKLWQVTPAINGNGCFAGCTGLSDYNEIPANWK